MPLHLAGVSHPLTSSSHDPWQVLGADEDRRENADNRKLAPVYPEQASFPKRARLIEEPRPSPRKMARAGWRGAIVRRVNRRSEKVRGGIMRGAIARWVIVGEVIVRGMMVIVWGFEAWRRPRRRRACGRRPPS